MGDTPVHAPVPFPFPHTVLGIVKVGTGGYGEVLTKVYIHS